MSSPPAGDAQAPAPPPPSLVPPVSDSSGGLPSKVPGGKTTLMALGVGIGIGGAIVLVLVCIFGALWYRRRNRGSRSPKDDHLGDTLPQWKRNSPLPVLDNAGGKAAKLPFQPLLPNSKQFSDDSTTPPPQSTSSSLASAERPLQLPSSDVTAFSYGELAVATDKFASTNLLGQGGFGYVFKGIHNGMEVAVKQLKVDSGQGEREFQAEVETISRVHHKHLVSLVGYCSSGDQRLLVYEFVPNKTLEFHLHETEHPIDWENRVKIAMGAAKGLAYLHEKCRPKIIHRDIKASNILLDDDFEAKVADFGLARFYPDTDTHVSTRVMGTFGYLAPEYAQTGKLTDKSDVFSFGVMLLELITGRRPIDKAQHYVDHNIVDWARPLLAQAMKDGNFDYIADPRLHQEYDVTQMARMVMSAAVSIRQLGRSRPRMSQVVRTLEGKISLEELDRDVGTQGSSSKDLYAGPGYQTGKYREDLEKFRKMALDDGDSSSGVQTSHSIS